MTLEEKDKYIAEHLMELTSETLRFLVADFRAEIERLSAAQIERDAAIVEIGQLKQALWPMKDKEIVRWKSAYENMRDFTVKSGLDITCYGAE